MRAVLDVNVLISALLSRTGTPARLLLAWQEGRFELIVSPGLLAELGRALAYPKLRRLIPASDAEAFVAWLSRSASLARDPDGPPPIYRVDPGERDASRVVNAYRSEFKSPLRSVVMGLRSAVRTAGVEVVVAERLKRQPRLVGNLIRFPNIRLTQMQDEPPAFPPHLRHASADTYRPRVHRRG